MEYDAACSLCRLERSTTWHYEGDMWVIFDCESCGTPMIVLKEHKTPNNDIERKVLEDAAAEIARDVFGERFDRIGKFQRKIMNHFHRHVYLRKK